jgi:hypothetical protein
MRTGVAVHGANLRLNCFNPVTTYNKALESVIFDHSINSHDPSQQHILALSAAFIDARDWPREVGNAITMVPQNLAFPLEAEKTGVEKLEESHLWIIWRHRHQ